MTIYWILLAVPALIALAYPLEENRGPLTVGHTVGLAAFAGIYALVSMLRFEVGGDWGAYEAMYEGVRLSSLGEAMLSTDPGFGLILWVSSELGLGIYPVNAICSLILVWGIVRVAATTQNPWAAVTISVPYLLIVVGMGYVRQAAAIGMILLAVVALGKEKPIGTIARLGAAMALHSTSVVVWPIFAVALANRNKLRILLLSTFGTAGFLFIASSRLTQFDAGYIGSEYDSSGALVRLLMGLLPSVLLIARWRHFTAPDRARPVWLHFALANVIAFFALGLSPSSTAVDRMALYFSAVQVIVFGNLSQLIGASVRTRVLLRFAMVAVAVAVQLVWLLFATHSSYWVPYKTVLAYL